MGMLPWNPCLPSGAKEPSGDGRSMRAAGYTNAGKSTLLNHLTNAGVIAEDMLFATLDPTTRKVGAHTAPSHNILIILITIFSLSPTFPLQQIEATP